MLCWDEEFHHISISSTEKMVHIQTDTHLMDFLALPKNGSLQLADYILEHYKTLYKEPLEINRYSLAIEILAHAYIDQFSKVLISLSENIKLPVIKNALTLLHNIQSKTEIIDCGELSIDSNRHIWDSLVPYHTAIFALLGKRA